MKKLFNLIMGMLAVAAVFCSCSDSGSDLYGELPQQVSEFVSQYFPNPKIASYTTSDTGETVVIDNGPTIVFNKDFKWISVNGNGSVLPQVLLFDQLPPSLYEYLQQGSNVNNVFMISRDKTSYTVSLLNGTLTYDIATGQITG